MIFFFNDTATTEIYTLSLHDALPILTGNTLQLINVMAATLRASFHFGVRILIATFHATVAIMIHRTIAQVILIQDRKSTRLNSSHANISYAVFCLKKKKTHPSTLSTI